MLAKSHSQMPAPAFYRGQAARCRRLAAALTTGEDIRRIQEIAQEYEVLARNLEQAAETETLPSSNR